MATQWMLEPTDSFKRDERRYKKKHPHEYDAIMVNLDKYFCVLQKSNYTHFITMNYLHPEPDGVIAIDQKGKSKYRLQQTRLYAYPDSSKKVLFLLAIGSKSGQSRDVNNCRKMVREIKKDK